jgi:hypothetical protein
MLQWFFASNDQYNQLGRDRVAPQLASDIQRFCFCLHFSEFLHLSGNIVRIAPFDHFLRRKSNKPVKLKTIGIIDGKEGITRNTRLFFAIDGDKTD